MDCTKCYWSNPETCRRCRQDEAEKLAHQALLRRSSAEPNIREGQRNPVGDSSAR